MDFQNEPKKEVLELLFAKFSTYFSTHAHAEVIEWAELRQYTGTSWRFKKGETLVFLKECEARGWLRINCRGVYLNASAPQAVPVAKENLNEVV